MDYDFMYTRGNLSRALDGGDECVFFSLESGGSCRIPEYIVRCWISAF